MYRVVDDALLLLAHWMTCYWTRHERRKSRDEPKKRKRWKAAARIGGATNLRFPVWVDWMGDVNICKSFNILLIDINIGKSWNIYVYQLRIVFFVQGI